VSILTDREKAQGEADLSRKRVAEAGLTGQVDIRIQDYRNLGDEKFDAISSIGMFEHVGHKRRDEYFVHLAQALTPYGRLLNHAISTPHGAKFDRRSFINRYVFPDGELHDVGETIVAAESAAAAATSVATERVMVISGERFARRTRRASAGRRRPLAAR